MKRMVVSTRELIEDKRQHMSEGIQHNHNGPTNNQAQGKQAHWAKVHIIEKKVCEVSPRVVERDLLGEEGDAEEEGREEGVAPCH